MLPSSGAEIGHLLEGRPATLERGGDCLAGLRGTLERGGDRSAGSRGCEWAARWAFFESFPFLRMGSRPWAFVGSTVLSGVCILKSGLSTPIRVSLIVVPDNNREITIIYRFINRTNFLEGIFLRVNHKKIYICHVKETFENHFPVSHS